MESGGWWLGARRHQEQQNVKKKKIRNKRPAHFSPDSLSPVLHPLLRPAGLRSRPYRLPLVFSPWANVVHASTHTRTLQCIYIYLYAVSLCVCVFVGESAGLIHQFQCSPTPWAVLKEREREKRDTQVFCVRICGVSTSVVVRVTQSLY